MFDIVSFIPRAVMQGIPLLLGSTGEILTEKSGNLNLGIPGVMYVGAISGVIGSFFYEQSLKASGKDINTFLGIMIPLLCSMVGSLLMGLIYSFLTVSLRANQNVTGLALTTLTSMLDRMEAASLIRRDRGDKDRRKILIYLTDEAKSLEKDYQEVTEEISNIYYKGFSKDEIAQLEEYLRRVLANVEERL